jgi:hypothetical protein
VACVNFIHAACQGATALVTQQRVWPGRFTGDEKTRRAVGQTLRRRASFTLAFSPVSAKTRAVILA